MSLYSLPTISGGEQSLRNRSYPTSQMNGFFVVLEIPVYVHEDLRTILIDSLKHP
jgi:hypothetical protein